MRVKQSLLGDSVEMGWVLAALAQPEGAHRTALTVHDDVDAGASLVCIEGNGVHCDASFR
ncbi:hypothetical protein [Paraburkholderia rhynchosiae]|uniref:hypothetical protein n=1 Tax=Paraburkholderia rhynchosiae TaxID=487049 RepID=UPI001ABFF38B|nr:hypothetical protein [Paraburkholderia rhynchosiae]